MVSPYVHFVDRVVLLDATSSPLALERAVWAAREAVADVYSRSLANNGIPEARFGLFLPAIEKLLLLCEQNPGAVERLTWYRRLFTVIAEEGLEKAARLIKEGANILAAGGHLSDIPVTAGY